MNTPLCTLSLIAALSLSACAPSSFTATRGDTATLAFAATEDASMHAQTAALNATANRLVTASTMKGAVIGAALGCGLTALSGAGADRCLTGAAVGAVGGGVIGNMKGKRDVQRRVRIADPNKLVRSVRTANDQMSDIAIGLPAYLAKQDTELHHLKDAKATGALSQADYDSAVAVIRADRARLAEALTLTSAQAEQANENLKAAASRGQTGLDWHILATNDIAQNATSARASISLL